MLAATRGLALSASFSPFILSRAHRLIDCTGQDGHIHLLTFSAINGTVAIVLSLLSYLAVSLQLSLTAPSTTPTKLRILPPICIGVRMTHIGGGLRFASPTLLNAGFPPRIGARGRLVSE